jgi:hypothetical protein
MFWSTPFSHNIPLHIGAKGRNYTFPFNPQNCPLTSKIDSTHLSEEGNSLHIIVKGMVGQRKRKVVGQSFVLFDPIPILPTPVPEQNWLK